MKSSDEIVARWIKFGGRDQTIDTCFVGKDTLAIAQSFYILFIKFKNVTKDASKFSIYEANRLGNETDGINCIAGHGVVSVFAIADNKMKAHIQLLAYPTFAQVAKLENKSGMGYQALAFSDGEIMVSLSHHADIILTIWNWMSGYELKTVNTNTTTFGQKLRCFSTAPILISQISEGTNELTVWEVSVCYTTCHVVSKPIKMPSAKYFSSCWTPEGILWFINDNGDIYYIEPETPKPTLFLQQKENFILENLKPCIGCYKSNLITTMTDGTLKIYKKDKGKWTPNTKTFGLKNPLLKLRNSLDWNVLIGWSNTGEILKIDFSDSNDGDQSYTAVSLTNFGDSTNDICIINHEQKHFASINYKELLQIWETNSGELVSTFETEGKCKSMMEHPSLPIIILGTDAGAVHFINLSDVSSPHILCSFVLDHFDVTNVIFDNSGMYAVAAGLDIGEFFVFQAFPRSNIFYQVTHHMNLQREILSLSIMASPLEFCLALLSPVPQLQHGNKRKEKEGNGVLRREEIKDMDSNEVNSEINQSVLTAPRQELVLYKGAKINKRSLKGDLETGNRLSLYTTLKLPICCPEDELKEGILDERHYYSELGISGGPFLKNTELYAFPMYSQTIHILETNITELLNADEAQLSREINTGHQIRCSGKRKKAVQVGAIREGDHMLMTYGADGLVFLRPHNTTKGCEEQGTALRNHHYIKGGVRKALHIPSMSFVVSFGWDGCIVGKRTINENQKHSSTVREIESKSSTEHANMIYLLKKMPQSQMAVPVKGSSKTWLQLEAEEIIRKEREISAKEKKAIFMEFEAVKSELNALIEKNMATPKPAQLPLFEFDLNRKLKEEKLQEAEVKMQEEELEILKIIKINKEKAEALHKECWDPMEIKGKCIKAIKGELEVENYPLLPEKPDFEEKVGQVIERRAMEIELTINRLFTPWIPKSDSYTKRLLQQGLKAAAQSRYSVKMDEKTRLYMAMMSASDEEPTQDAGKGVPPAVTETDVADFKWSGSTSHKFVTIPECLHRQQLELYTFNASFNETIILEYIINKLRRYFNNEFEKTMDMKMNVMSKSAENVARLHKIKSEHLWCLNAANSIISTKISTALYESSNVVEPAVSATVIFEPNWDPREIPETGIMMVDNSEVNAIPYLTPEEEELLTEKVREEELMRKRRAADNFREVALIEMMDGVLEKCWEDVIKKDVLKPAFMETKIPEEWNENEIKMAKEYETKVKFLNSERDRYRKILENEFEIRNDDHMGELTNFDKKLLDLHKLKLQIDASIAQENMKMISMQLRNDKILSLKNKEQKLLKELSEVRKEIEGIEMEIKEMRAAAQECASIYELIAQKDRQLEQSFRKENEFSSTVSEQRQKSFRRRPKVHIRSMLSMSLIAEVWKLHGPKTGIWREVRGQMTEQKKSTSSPAYNDLLTQDAVDFLQTLDSMDAYANAFPGIDEEGWVNLCKLRRGKIQNELKLKIAAQELVDSNYAVEQGQKYLKSLNNKIEKFQEELNFVRKSKLDICHDAQVQLILKNGMIEIDRDGSINDFSDAILIHQSVIDKVNEDIKEKGEVKLKAMRDYADFRRTVLLCEWEHKKMKMEIQDLEAQIKTLESTKVSKDMLIFLASPDKAEKAPWKLEKEINFLKETFGKKTKKFQDQMDDLDKKVVAKERENKRLDNAIRSLNIDVNEQLLNCDPDLEQKASEASNARMATLVKRSELVNEIQSQYNDILVLQTELELLRLKTFPTFRYTTIP